MIKILPYDQLVSDRKSVLSVAKSIENKGNENITDLIGTYSTFGSGRDAIGVLAKNLKLEKHNEVYITTTTDSSFVSTCVSATLFNHCRISRVLTEMTKAIFVIHSFGFAHPNLLMLRKTATERNIPLIEDCAFAFDSYTEENIRLGSVGDYSIYSLPKIVPAKYGGILAFKTEAIVGITDKYIDTTIKTWFPKLWYLKKQRTENYQFLYKTIKNPIYGQAGNQNPFMFGYKSRNYIQIMKKNSNMLEFGLTHVDGEVHIPVNPFIQSYNQLTNQLIK
jgi:hypothetical protein